ncbi:MAG TPA: serine/threonine-protein kinase, partial [Thermoanaerobaculia bacterium]|nr:serine/threonine-protein kinase [Thermoanaerobaculia bacterium]
MREGREDTETVGEVVAAGPRIPTLAPGTVVAERFEIIRALGSGGSSIVYEALDKTLRTRVALKILRADRATPAALKRLHREAKIAREAQDPRLVRVWDIGESAEGPFISMELVEGESLADLIQRGPMKVADAVRIATEVLAALDRLHALGIIHRDLKPSNVLLAPDGAVKLVDFGLARHWDSDESRATQAEALVGTVEYLSPEQALGKPLDPRTDLYSLGIVLFEMLTAAVPFKNESTFGAVLAHINQRAPDMRELRPDLPAWLVRIVSRLLEKRAGDRYGTAAQVLEDLGRRRARFKVRRRTWIAGAIVLSIGLAAAGAWHLMRPRFASFAKEPDGITAMDANGHELWRVDGPFANAAVLRRDGAPVSVAVTRDAKTLMLLDPDTGRTKGEIPIPDASWAF